MSSNPRLTVAFFDIGATLGAVDDAFALHPYPGVEALLRAMRDVLGLRLGVITNVPADWTVDRVATLLADAGLASYFESPAGLVTSVAADASKPASAVYEYAAAQMGVTTGECVFVGENADEVRGAIRAGMAGIHKVAPSND